MGRLWVSEYGNPDDPADLPVLHRTSPLHNINPDAVHPAVLVTTADHDTRVVPGHSLKYLAELQGGSCPRRRRGAAGRAACSEGGRQWGGGDEERRRCPEAA